MLKVFYFALLSGVFTAAILAAFIGGIFWIASLAGSDVNVLLSMAKAGGVGFVIGVVVGLYSAGSVHNNNDL